MTVREQAEAGAEELVAQEVASMARRLGLLKQKECVPSLYQLIRAALTRYAAQVRREERERLHTLLESCHAAIDPETWPDVVEAVCAEFDSCGGDCAKVREARRAFQGAPEKGKG